MPFPILAAIAGGQALLGALQIDKASRDYNNAAKQRTAYKTPSELYDVLNMTQQNAQSGFDPETMAYLSNSNDRAFSSSLGASQRLGGDPNSFAAMFDSQLQNIFKVGAQNHALQMENFSKFINATETIGASKTAEWQSQQDILKDKMAAANANKAAGWANVSGGINTGLSAFAANKTAKLGEIAGGGTTSATAAATLSPLQQQYNTIVASNPNSMPANWSSAALPYNDFRIPR